MTEFADQKECLEAIGAFLVENATEPWTEIQIVAEVFDDGLVSMQMHYRPEADPSQLVWYEIEDGATEVNFAQCFQELADLVQAPGQGRFRECRYHLKNGGEYAADYVY